MRRRKRLVALAGLAVVVAAGTVVLWPRPERITWENCARIRQGMTLAELQTVLGEPGYFKTGPVEYRLQEHRPFVLQADWVEGRQEAYWLTDTGFAVVYFDDAERVADFSFIPGRRVEQPFLTNLLWRLGRRWQSWVAGDDILADSVVIDPLGCPIPLPD